MEYKLKENVKVNSLFFKKKVLEEAIDLMGAIKNYTNNNIKFNLMLSFLDCMVEGNALLEKLAESTRLADEINDTVEPLFNQVMEQNVDYKVVFEELLQELKEFCDREVENNRRMTGFISTILNEVGNLSQEETMQIIQQIFELASNGFVQKIKTDKPAKSVKTQEEIRIENEKMLDLINQFAKKGNIAE